MEKILKNFLQNELVHVELVVLIFLLLLLIISSLFKVKIGRFSYVAVLALIVIPLLWFLGKWIINLVKQIDFPTIEPWMWISVGALILLIWLIPKIPSVSLGKRPKFKSNWFWGIVTLLIFAGFVYWRWTVGEIQKAEKEYWAPNAYIPPSVFNLDSTNTMKKGEPKRFTQGPGDLLHFYPKDADTIVYTITKLENRTRTWSVKAWRDSKGNPKEVRLNNLEPTDEAKRGPSEISVDRDASVVVLEGNK